MSILTYHSLSNL